MNHLNLETVDVDGAIRETAEAAAPDSRAAFLAKAGMLGGGVLGAGALFALMTGEAKAQSRRDVAILNFALTLEYLEAAFYTEAVAMRVLDGELRLFARVVAGHERAHVRALKGALGRAAVAKPRFNFRGTTEDPAAFAATAQVLEDTGVQAYAGQAPRVRSDAVLDAALAIHTVEARHASWIRGINGDPEAPRAFDRPLTQRQVLARVADTRFIVPRRRRTQSQAAPQFTG
jgi:Ferritin-like domain